MNNPWYHEPLETGRSYIVREADLFMGGFGLQLKKTDAPYWAHVQSLDNGFAKCLCTDGVTRVLPTPQLTWMVRTRTVCGR